MKDSSCLRALKAGQEETALCMLRDGGLPVEKIAEYSGLAVEEVERLVKPC